MLVQKQTCLMNGKHVLRIMKKQLYTKNHKYPNPSSKTSPEARQHRPVAEQEPPFQGQH